MPVFLPGLDLLAQIAITTILDHDDALLSLFAFEVVDHVDNLWVAQRLQSIRFAFCHVEVFLAEGKLLFGREQLVVRNSFDQHDDAAATLP